MYFHFIRIITPGIRFLYSHYAEKEIESLTFNKLSRAIQLVSGGDRISKVESSSSKSHVVSVSLGGQPDFL